MPLPDRGAVAALARLDRGELAALLDRTQAFVRRYVVMTDVQATAVTLWVAATHALDATDTTAYLHITSAEAESGKTRLVEMLEMLVPRPLTTAGSVTVAVMFRVISAMKPTLLLDEADNIFADKTQRAELLGVINAGWRRGQRVYRMGGTQHDRLDEFEVFCAKAIAGLDRKLAPTLASRCVRIEMRRRLDNEPLVDLFRDEAEPLAEVIRSDLASWAEHAVDDLRAARPARLGVRDRLEEGLRLLLAIAAAAGHEWEQQGRVALRELAGVSTASTDTFGVELLRDIRTVFGSADELATADLLAGLFTIEESPWASWWSEGKPDEIPKPTRAAAMKLARILKTFGVTSHNVGENRRKGYRLADFADAFARYLPSEVAQVAQTALLSQKTALSRSLTEPAASDLDWPANPHEQTIRATERPQTVKTGPEPSCHDERWLARDGRWRCSTCEPPVSSGEVIETRGVV